ncbi:PhzF family phenazine biosynthesis protein [Streptococcus parauberis]|uniref:PhzF family phenazine biosynthesis protein n=1 Tax=Streptococcus parauberis TaxID=1348 RepID=UPI000CCE1D5E|nr:PhzF family phenazine biosynthesis protein [Streptococcus parauberis]PNY20244.1 Trans-2,3-dihydro-3-hydroxyanthranilate isomerase [Streptococcus parauberis]
MLPYYVVNAFTDVSFSGNPAGVVVLENELEEKLMQKIAKENNLSETAFIVREKNYYNIRWFTPQKEVDLCGHATLASAFVISHFLESNLKHITFSSKSGLFEVVVNENEMTIYFSTVKIDNVKITSEMNELFDIKVLEAYKTNDKEHLILVMENQEAVENLCIDLERISKLASHGVTATALSDESDNDYVLRYFAPNYGISEDPVTGSAQTRLAPLWIKKLGKKQLVSKQLSERKGIMIVELDGEKVKITGQAKLYLEGQLTI